MKFFKQADKHKHIILCFLSAIISPMLSIGLAVGKEYGDKCNPNNKWDWYDILADAIGVIIGSLVHYLIF